MKEQTQSGTAPTLSLTGGPNIAAARWPQLRRLRAELALYISQSSGRGQLRLQGLAPQPTMSRCAHSLHRRCVAPAPSAGNDDLLGGLLDGLFNDALAAGPVDMHVSLQTRQQCCTPPRCVCCHHTRHACCAAGACELGWTHPPNSARGRAGPRQWRSIARCQALAVTDGLHAGSAPQRSPPVPRPRNRCWPAGGPHWGGAPAPPAPCAGEERAPRWVGPHALSHQLWAEAPQAVFSRPQTGALQYSWSPSHTN